MVRTLALACALAIFAGPSLATVIGGGIIRQQGDGKFVKLETDNPFSVGFDTFDDDNLYAFDEDQNILLEKSIRVDIGGDQGVIEAGTVVASHYVFFDSYVGAQYGYVDFDADILGIAALEHTMAATDFLANTSVTYISPSLRGLEWGDTVWIDEEDPKRLWVSWVASSPGDYIRVFTEKSIGAIASR